MGEVQVPSSAYWGAQTERSRNNFKIGKPASMPVEIITAFGYVKKASAIANYELGILSEDKMNMISDICDEITDGKLADHFPLVIWQTGSGTQTNMNVNEVITNRAHVKNGGSLLDKERELHPNDDVNKSQSSNDTFPTAMHIAACLKVARKTIPALERLRNTLSDKSDKYSEIIKTGRTHMMDAVPLTLGQEFSGYVSQINNGLRALRNSLEFLSEIALGGSAVGTGLNTPEGFPEKTAEIISALTGENFISAQNKFEALAAHDSMVELSAVLKRVAVSLTKIGNDLRLLSSGPRCGIGELILPENEPGSSIMPGKVNPTQIEALTMVCAQVMANDLAVTIGGANGHLELNTYKPLIAYNVLQSADLLADVTESFRINCIEGLKPDNEKIEKYLNNSLMLITTLTPHIGYDKSAKIARKAYEGKMTLREAAVNLGFVTGSQFDEWVDPSKMV